MTIEGGSKIEKVLVVDDNVQNRRLAEAHLVAAGYSVVLAENGEMALVMLEEHKPDLVLLDILMPGMNGFETCKRIRDLQSGRDIAIVFFTALNDLGSHEQALKSGADDFLTKPVNRTELLVRVRSLLWVKRLKDDLKQGYDLIRSQRDALLSAQRQREELTELIVHDLKNPLAAVIGNAEFLASEPNLPADFQGPIRDILQPAKSMLSMVMNLLDISRSEDGALLPQWSKVDLQPLIEEVRVEARRRVGERRQRIEVRGANENQSLRADRDLLRRLLENLIDNAIKYSPAESTIHVESRAEKGCLEIRISDEGPGVPVPYREKIFEKYVRLDPTDQATVRTSRGLGLTFCRLAVEMHGGRIWVEDNQPKGSAFCVSLPAME